VGSEGGTSRFHAAINIFVCIFAERSLREVVGKYVRRPHTATTISICLKFLRPVGGASGFHTAIKQTNCLIYLLKVLLEK
jgi:hypothetical protein